jgi:hypothetical protein
MTFSTGCQAKAKARENVELCCRERVTTCHLPHRRVRPSDPTRFSNRHALMPSSTRHLSMERQNQLVGRASAPLHKRHKIRPPPRRSQPRSYDAECVTSMVGPTKCLISVASSTTSRRFCSFSKSFAAPGNSLPSRAAQRLQNDSNHA